MTILIPPVSPAPNIGSYSGNTNNNLGGKLNPVRDLSSADQSTPLDPDLQQLALAASNGDFSSQAQELFIDLIRIMMQIRSQNRSIWQDEQNVAFKTAGNTASYQRNQAKHTAQSEIFGAVATIMQSAAEAGMAGGTAAAAGRKITMAKNEAKGMDFSEGLGSANGEIASNSARPANDVPAGAPAQFRRPADAPPAYSATQGAAPITDTQSPAPVTRADLGKTGAKVGKAGAKGATDANNAPTTEEAAPTPAPLSKAAQAAKAKWLADTTRNIYSEQELVNRAINATITVLANSVFKMWSAQETIKAGSDQGAATIEQAVMQYLQSQSQYSGDYASEMDQAIKSIFDTLRSVEQARHQAAQTTTQIV